MLTGRFLMSSLSLRINKKILPITTVKTIPCESCYSAACHPLREICCVAFSMTLEEKFVNIVYCYWL